MKLFYFFQFETQNYRAPYKTENFLSSSATTSFSRSYIWLGNANVTFTTRLMKQAPTDSLVKRT